MIVKFMDAGYIVAADDHVGHGKTAMVSGVWGDWGDAGFHTMMEDEHSLKKLVCEKYPNLPYFIFGHSMGSFIARDYAAKYGEDLAGVTICGTTGVFRGCLLYTSSIHTSAKEVTGIKAGQAGTALNFNPHFREGSDGCFGIMT